MFEFEVVHSLSWLSYVDMFAKARGSSEPQHESASGSNLRRFHTRDERN